MGQTNVNVPSDGSAGMGSGMIVGLILALIVIGFVVWYFLLSGGGNGSSPSHSVSPSTQVLPSLPVPSALRGFLVG